MGIYIQGYGTLSGAGPKGMTGRLLNYIQGTGSPKGLAGDIIETARRWSAEKGLEDLFYAVPSETGVWLNFYPPAGGFEFEINGNSIAFGVKTSIAGPGYHAALVDLCDQLQRDLGIVWRWDSGGDETGFALDRNFERLQEAFLDQATAFGQFHRDKVWIAEGHAVNLPEGLAIDCRKDAATPLGPVPNHFFLDAPDSAEDAEALAQRLFPWWSNALDRQFWTNTLRALLWTEVQWRGARTPWEEHVYRTAILLGKRFRPSLDKDLAGAVEELAELSKVPESFVIPASTGIGYLRRKRAFFLPGPWRINLPGYYIEQDEDEGNTTCLWYGEEEIRGSSFTIQTDDAESEIWNAELAGEPDREGIGCKFRIQPGSTPSMSSPGYFDSTAEFVARRADGRVHLLILSMFGAEEGLTQRLAEIANGVWFDEQDSRQGGTAN